MIPKDPAQLVLFVQRYSGIAAFVLLFIQILIGRFAKKHRWHYFLAVLIFSFIFIHIFSYIFFVYKIKGIFDPFYPFTDLCLLCKNVVYPEYLVNFGRIALWLISIAVFVSIFRKTHALKKYWRKIHFLNCFAFFLVALHGWFLGSDFKTIPLKYFFGISLLIVSLIAFKKLRQPL